MRRHWQGSPAEGNADYSGASAQAATALECRDQEWRTLQCRGASGCTESEGTIQCDMRGNLPGDSCAASAEGRGLCTANAKALLECRMGVLALVKTCGSCVMDLYENRALKATYTEVAGGKFEVEVTAKAHKPLNKLIDRKPDDNTVTVEKL